MIPLICSQYFTKMSPMTPSLANGKAFILLGRDEASDWAGHCDNNLLIY
jgi:hypothetical protein